MTAKDEEIVQLKEEILNLEQKSQTFDETIEKVKNENLNLSQKCQRLEVHIIIIFNDIILSFMLGKII